MEHHGGREEAKKAAYSMQPGIKEEREEGGKLSFVGHIPSFSEVALSRFCHLLATHQLMN